MRKIIILICLLLLLFGLATTASAANSVSISLSANDTSVGSGDQVTITVKATVDQCGSGGIEVSYDTNRFELVSGEWLLDSTLSHFKNSDRIGVFALENDKAISGKVFQLVIKVKSNAPLGSGNVTFKFTADKKDVSKSISIKVQCNHKYSNNCDTTCNSCGAKRTITHKWNAGSVTKAATCTTTGSMKYTCTVCKTTKTEKLSKTAHSYDHDCDTDCNSCGGKRETTHIFSWTCDSADHWQACSICGLEQERQAHELGTGLTGNESGHGYLCSICNLIPDAQIHDFDSNCDPDCAVCEYKRTIDHYYSERWSYDKEEHWHECTVCGDIPEKYAHTPSDAATETTDQICLSCGYLIAPAGNHIHSKSGDWQYDRTGHWYLCRCGHASDSYVHRWDSGEIDAEKGTVIFLCIDCGYASAEVYVPEVEPTEPENDFVAFLERVDFVKDIELFDTVPLWAAVMAFATLSLLVNIILVICLITSAGRVRKLKKQKEAIGVE